MDGIRGFSLVEALAGVAVLGAGALGIALALGQAEQLAASALRRDREAGLRADLAARSVLEASPGDLVNLGTWSVIGRAGVDGMPGTADDLPAGPTCWGRAISAPGGLIWIEVRCAVSGDDLPAARSEPGLLVAR
jgi:hypothetical protein